MRVIISDSEHQYLYSPAEEIVPIFWNFDQNLLIGEAAVSFERGCIVADIALFEDLAPDWFIGMLHDCPDVWGVGAKGQEILMLGVSPPCETDLTMLILEKLAEFREEN